MRYERTFGKPGERPDTYWHPFLGARFNLRPADLHDLSCEQLMACVEYLEGD